MKTVEAVRALQDRLASLLGCEPKSRADVIASMLQRTPREIFGYWLQLSIAAGIALLGLVLGSTAVIIGAMLVAPLMGPIVGLGMGLAAGSTVLVLRAAGRVLGSVAVVVAIGAGLTKVIPFHEINAEIAARTTPTALDLGIAVFCAMAGVFATLRPSSDVASTAAGTSIGISLVPPLCVSGYGLGTSAAPIAVGAALLFLTNLAAIIFVSTLSFAAIGFGQVEVIRLDREELDRGGGWVLHRPLARRFAEGVRWALGRWLRLIMPILLLGALYSPLRSGLDRVAWEIEARGEVKAAISGLPHRLVQSRVRIERNEIGLVIFLLGSQNDAIVAREQLSSEISRATGVVPHVEVYAVPDASEFEALERAQDRSPPVMVAPPPPPPPPPEPKPSEQIGDAMTAISEVLEHRWPSAAAGDLIAVSLAAPEQGTFALQLVHLGPQIDDAARDVLATALGDDLELSLSVDTVSVPTEPLSLEELDPATVDELARRLGLAASIPRLRACLVEPERVANPRPLKPSAEAARAIVAKLLDGQPRLERQTGGPPSLLLSGGACPVGPAPPP